MWKHVRYLASIVSIVAVSGIVSADRLSYWADDNASLCFAMSIIVLFLVELQYLHWSKTRIAQKYRLPFLADTGEHGFTYKIPLWLVSLIIVSRSGFALASMWFGYPDFFDAPMGLWFVSMCIIVIALILSFCVLGFDVWENNSFYNTEELRYNEARRLLGEGWCIRDNLCHEHVSRWRWGLPIGKHARTISHERRK